MLKSKKMPVKLLEQYLPEGSLPFLQKWFADYFIHIKITKSRESKLGDYRKLPDGSHKITLNSTMEPQLFFLTLTHELAHLIAFENHTPKRIASHGAEWKQTFRGMLMESISVYAQDLQPVIMNFARSPKAIFNSDPALVKYFHTGEDTVFMEDLAVGERFLYKSELYTVDSTEKKKYLCTNQATGKKYYFKGIAVVKKL